jgi:hypothetical protein
MCCCSSEEETIDILKIWPPRALMIWAEKVIGQRTSKLEAQYPQRFASSEESGVIFLPTHLLLGERRAKA